MTDPDLRRVIVEHLTRPVSSRQADEIARGEPEPARPVARVVRGNVVTADPATIEFVKGRGTDWAAVRGEIHRPAGSFLAVARRG